MLTYSAEIPESKVEVVDYKTDMKTKLEIQIIIQVVMIMSDYCICKRGLLKP